MKRVRLLIVDDSAAFRAALAAALARDAELEIVGQAGDGEEALRLVDRLQPDVVTMDVVMPKLDGLEASKRILASDKPLPIILMSTLARSEEQRVALNALRLGVMDVTNKPVLVGEGAAAAIAGIARLIKAAAHLSVAPRRRSGRFKLPSLSPERKLELIAVAASTGGPPALEEILGKLPPNFPPIVVAQHLAPSFAAGFADWLGGSLGRTVVPVTFMQPLDANTIYVAGESSHIRVRAGRVEPLRCGHTELAPNADVLFTSVAETYRERALGIVLTGMGNDGAIGLMAMKQAGAWTIAQDSDSSVVYGMPRVAWEAGACSEQLALELVGARIAALLTGNKILGMT
jgi:two-component system, chemotaxis family, protein-glutamate methylesterase/glutaminase